MTGVGGIPPGGQSCRQCGFLTGIAEESHRVSDSLKKLDIKSLLGVSRLKNNLVPILCAALTLLTASCFYGIAKEIKSPEAATNNRMKLLGLCMAFLAGLAGTGTLAILLISSGRHPTLQNRSAEQA